MHIFDIIGPVMIGPSSSHTAGAAKIGYVTRKLLGERPVQAEILLHGSFSATGSGHGTDRAIVAGLLGYKPDDERLPNSFAEAEKAGLSFQLTHGVIRNAHPNTAKIHAIGENGNELEVVGASIGGGRIKICEIDGICTNFSGEYRTQHGYTGARRTGNHHAGTKEREHCNHAAISKHTGRLCCYDS